MSRAQNVQAVHIVFSALLSTAGSSYVENIRIDPGPPTFLVVSIGRVPRARRGGMVPLAHLALHLAHSFPSHHPFYA